MKEENGHVWQNDSGSERCKNCDMKYEHYLMFKGASEAQPYRDDLKKWLKCKNRNWWLEK
jgi:hypothetical protein